jgi:hypothetical protein
MSTSLITLNLSSIESEPSLKKACVILKNARESANTFFELYAKERVGKTGAPTYKEQDLLRAMLVFSASGLDSTIKQLIKDALPLVVKTDIGAKKEFESFIKSKLSSRDGAVNTSLLSEIITGNDPQSVAIGLYVEELTSDSLQSKDQLFRVAASFAINGNDIFDANHLAGTFSVRQQIIHEMDADFESPSFRNRLHRTKTDMVKRTNNLISGGEKFIKKVNEKKSTSLNS